MSEQPHCNHHQEFDIDCLECADALEAQRKAAVPRDYVDGAARVYAAAYTASRATGYSPINARDEAGNAAKCFVFAMRDVVK